MNGKKAAEIAALCGFSAWAPMNVPRLNFLQENSDMCAAGHCVNYGKSWSCPPACPPPEAGQRLAAGFDSGLLVQTVCGIEDSFDWPGIQKAGEKHTASFRRMWGELESGGSVLFAMGAGACTFCENCSFPAAPCRCPGSMAVSMEAFGLDVGKVCSDNGLEYCYGPGTITFTSCFLYGASHTK